MPTLRMNRCLAAIIVAALSVRGQMASGCIACYRPPYRSLLEKVELSEHVVVARMVEETRSGWQVEIVRVIKGNGVDVGQIVTVDRSPSDRMTAGESHLLRRTTLDSSWIIQGPIDRALLQFLIGGVALSSGRPAQTSIRAHAQAVRYYLPYLEHPHPQIADSAYIKLVKAPYAAVRTLGTEMEPDQLLAWISDRQITPKRGALYITLLGICGGERESKLLKEWIDQGWDRQKTDHLAALLTAHGELHGEETVRLIEKSYLQNRDRQLGELIAAITALRVHGQADGKIPRARIQTSFHLLLKERPALLELIVEDCARWKDWSFAPKLMEIYAGGKQPWNNALIIKYLEACPLPDAKQFLQHLSRVKEPLRTPSSRRE